MTGKTSNKISFSELKARKAALECLMSVIHKHETLDNALCLIHTHRDLSSQEKSFAEFIIRATLKHYYPLSAFISQFLIKPWSKLPTQVQLLLVMASVQIHLMQVPAYAAVNTTVELAKRIKLHSMTGMMNVVLKKVSQHSAKSFLESPAAHLPSWLVKRLEKDYGETKASDILRCSFEDVTTIDLTLKQPEHPPQLLQGESLSPFNLRIASTAAITRLEGFAEGQWWVQDVASAWPVYALCEQVKGKKVLDACAAPGGKTMQLCHYGADVTALDRSKPRLERLKENLARTHAQAEIICADILDYTPATLYDVIVVDAPCTATGTLRRNPDILYHRNENDIQEVITLQSNILNKAAGWLSADGILLYCVCSLFKEEGEMQMQWLQSAYPELTLFPLDNIPSYMLTDEGYYRALPFYHRDEGGMDGFFAAAFRKEVGGIVSV